MKSKYAVFIGIGFELVILLVGAIQLGNFIEAKYDLKGLGLTGLCLGALIAWMTHVIVLAKKIEAEDEKVP